MSPSGAILAWLIRGLAGGLRPVPKDLMRKRRIFVGLFVLLCAAGPFVSMMGNPRVAALHGSDVLGLIGLGLCVGFGLGLLLCKVMFGGE